MFTGFMSTIVKTAGFAALYRILSVAFTELYGFWWLSILAVAIFTLLISNLTAVYQNSFKRMMAYSSISHAGYLLLAVTALKDSSQDSIIFYSAAYSFATVIAFGVLINVADNKGSEDFEAFNGLAKNNPFLAFALTIAMLSLAGIPMTAGFVGKFLIFSSAFERGGMTTALVIAILMSAVSIYYYLKVIIAMYMKDGNTVEIELSSLQRMAFWLALALTIVLGVYPSLLTNLFV